MGNYDDLYDIFQMANEQRKRDNFNAFMTGFNLELIKDLNETYASGDMKKYEEIVVNIKKQGIRIYRNNEGQHRLKFI